MKFKVKTEHPAERCEVCHQADQFERNQGYCARCRIFIRNFSARTDRPSGALVNQRIVLREFNKAKIVIEKPYDLAVKINNDSLTLKYSDNLHLKKITPFLAIVAALLFFINVTSINVNPGFVLFLSALAIMLAISSGTNTIKVADNRLNIYSWKYFPNVYWSVEAALIDQIFVTRQFQENRDSTPATEYYLVKAILTSGVEINLVKCERQIVAHYIEQQLENHLNISDRVVEGEDNF